MTSSRPAHGPGRFIPREQLQGFASWRPGALGGAAAMPEPPLQAPPDPKASTAPPPEPAAPAPPPGLSPAEHRAAVAAARQAGYADGYRDGLVALDSFKQSYAQQVSGQLGSLFNSLGQALDAVEQDMAATVVDVALQLAREVVRGDLAARPQQVAQVASEAVNAVLMSARHLVVQVHPDDHALVAQGAAEALAARGARLLADPSVPRGGCRVDSDAGHVDASVAQRWRDATQALGGGAGWDEAGA
jgi:flagellar assembly protein FliH